MIYDFASLIDAAPSNAGHERVQYSRRKLKPDDSILQTTVDRIVPTNNITNLTL